MHLLHHVAVDIQIITDSYVLYPTDWMPDECWDNITELDKLPGFHGVQDGFETLSKEWREWYLNPEPELQPLLGTLHPTPHKLHGFETVIFIPLSCSRRMERHLQRLSTNSVRPLASRGPRVRLHHRLHRGRAGPAVRGAARAGYQGELDWVSVPDHRINWRHGQSLDG